MTGIIPSAGHRGVVVVLDAAGVIGRGMLAAALEAEPELAARIVYGNLKTVINE